MDPLTVKLHQYYKCIKTCRKSLDSYTTYMYIGFVHASSACVNLSRPENEIPVIVSSDKTTISISKHL